MISLNEGHCLKAKAREEYKCGLIRDHQHPKCYNSLVNHVTFLKEFGVGKTCILEYYISLCCSVRMADRQCGEDFSVALVLVVGEMAC